MMKRLILIFIILVLFSGLSAKEINLSWNIPELQRSAYRSWLMENKETIPDSLSLRSDHYDAAISSPSKFIDSFKRYVALDDVQSSFFAYKPQKGCRYLQLNLQAGTELASTDSSYYFLHYGWQIKGRLSENLSFYSQFWTGHFNNDNQQVLSSPLVDTWIKQQDDQVYLDNLRGKILYEDTVIKAGLGRGKYQIGSGISGSVILSDFCNDYGYWHFDLKLGDFCFSTLNASLTADSSSYLLDSGNDFRYNENKFLTVHDLSWQSANGIKLFVGEEVIYGARNTDLSYLLPVNFIRAIEHNLGDNDNVMIYAGGEWKSGKNLLYANFVLDELRKSEIFGNWWGNKYGIQLGNAVYLAKDKKDHLGVEFTAIRPWLYTHKSYLTRFSHDNRGLGFPEGSNLIQAALDLAYSVTPKLKINSICAFIRQGETGNSYELDYEKEIDDIQNEETQWLAGNPQNRWKLDCIISWQPLAHHWLKTGITSHITDNNTENEFYLSWLTKY